MRICALLPVFLLAAPSLAFGQASGNVGYGQPYGKIRPEQNERSKRVVTPAEMPPSSNSMFLEASVLMNVKADEFVAVFGISEEGETVTECNQKTEAVIKEFTGQLKSLGINEREMFVDFVTQNKIYGYKVDTNVAREALVGFELKKNISIHYRDKLLLDKLVIAASRAAIFDLIKVDYIVRETEPIQNRLMEEAAGVLKLKADRYEKLLGIRLLNPPQVYAEKPSIYYPTEQYESYTAFEAERVDREQYRQRYTIQDLRKSRTFYYNALNPDGFDRVIDPVVLEPVVQFTLYLKVKYDLEPRSAKAGNDSRARSTR